MGNNIDNVQLIINVLGGLGLFLLGMIIMTDGLRALAGDAMRAALIRFTRSPTSGAVTGAATTALLQSSSATTVAAVGFVAAGLLTFPQALGIVFGANIGTTITGWMVALLGFKLKLGTLVLPIIFLGAVLKLFASARVAAWGMAGAGFGLIFVGISSLQDSMAGLQAAFSFDALPGDSILGRLGLLGLGIVFTTITQSSSAGVAATLSALHAGLINFEQAAAMVVGMDVGTSIKAALATIGASTEARRTGISHVIYNLMTGIIAFLLIVPYTWLLGTLAPQMLVVQAEISLVAFHTGFNVLCLGLVLPFAERFVHMMTWLIPQRGVVYGNKLDTKLLDHPELAITAVNANINTQFLALLDHLDAILNDEKENGRANLQELARSLDETQNYLDRIHIEKDKGTEWERLVGLIQSMDHLQRLHERCEEDEDRAMRLKEIRMLKPDVDEMLEIISLLRTGSDDAGEALRKKVRKLSKRVRHSAGDYRTRVSEDIALGNLDIPSGTQQMEAIRWLERVCDHLARITRHLSEVVNATGK